VVPMMTGSARQTCATDGERLQGVQGDGSKRVLGVWAGSATEHRCMSLPGVSMPRGSYRR